MNNDTDYYKPLSKEILDEKVNASLSKGFDLTKLKLSMLEEKHDLQRSLLRQEAYLHKVKLTIQNMEEVIRYIEFLTAKGDTTNVS